MVQAAGKLGGESLAVCTHVWECGSRDLPQGTVLGDKTHVKNRHIFPVRIRKKCCERWSKYLCFLQSHHLCAETKLLAPVPEDQHLQVDSHLEASHHIRPRKCSTALGYLGTETKVFYSTTAQLCVSEWLPLALLAISRPERETYLWVCVGLFALGFLCHILAWQLGAAGRERSRGAMQCWESFVPSGD